MSDEPWTYEPEKYENHGGADVFHHVVAGTRHIAEVETEEDAHRIVADRQVAEQVLALADLWEKHAEDANLPAARRLMWGRIVAKLRATTNLGEQP
jgi:hypothetical protein